MNDDLEAVRAYYAEFDEAGRLWREDEPAGPLERVRTQELLVPHLPPPPGRILDVGGAAGVYASWLADLGHEVHLVDPVEHHVAAAAEDTRVTATGGDARRLEFDDDAFDVVLLLGPLYHLTVREERLVALREARRVLRPGGVLAAAGVSRYAAMYDLLIRHDVLHAPGFLDVVADAIPTGAFRGRDRGMFTDTHHHLPSELREEVAEVGFRDVTIHAVEGPGGFVTDFAARWADPERREVLLEAARLADTSDEVRAATSHLLAVARTP